MMTISVIIPCYNAQTHLGACIDSVMRQRFSDIEIILIDDGSTDDTAQIAQAYVQKDERIVYVRQENAGVSAARNVGLNLAQGEWVTFVDADDLLPMGALETLFNGVAPSVDCVIAAHETFDQTGIAKKVTPEKLFLASDMDQARDIVIRRLIEGDCAYNIMCAKLHRRAQIEKYHIRLWDEVHIAEDALFNLEALYHARRFVYVDSVAYSYRIHEQSAMALSSGQELTRQKPFFNALWALLLRLGIERRYFKAYVDSVTLRAYKQYGLIGMLRKFNSEALPLIDARGEGTLRHILQSGLYPAVYPFIFLCQVTKRKCEALGRWINRG